jgi:hypothetical protein
MLLCANGKVRLPYPRPVIPQLICCANLAKKIVVQELIGWGALPQIHFRKTEKDVEFHRR